MTYLSVQIINVLFNEIVLCIVRILHRHGKITNLTHVMFVVKHTIYPISEYHFTNKDFHKAIALFFRIVYHCYFMNNQYFICDH